MLLAGLTQGSGSGWLSAALGWSQLGGLEHLGYVLCVSRRLAQNVLLLVMAEVQQCKWKCFFQSSVSNVSVNTPMDKASHII